MDFSQGNKTNEEYLAAGRVNATEDFNIVPNGPIDSGRWEAARMKAAELGIPLYLPAGTYDFRSDGSDEPKDVLSPIKYDELVQKLGTPNPDFGAMVDELNIRTSANLGLTTQTITRRFREAQRKAMADMANKSKGGDGGENP